MVEACAAEGGRACSPLKLTSGSACPGGCSCSTRTWVWMVGSLLWSVVSTPQVTPSFHVFLQLREQAINLCVSMFLYPPVPSNPGEGFSYLGYWSWPSRAAGPGSLSLASFLWLALVNFVVVAARHLCSDLVPLGQQRWWQDPRWW